ncbi:MULTISPECIES: tetratricopeptide repeat protein [Amycolatopsis]|uniref:tetratricopeptide repeat protein n=1 Tax=Amycolatopsis TaxID=1813 RepID=UPI000B85ACBC|nr:MULTISPECIES: sel1 repeat family protein [Amycolatopsis]
MDEVVKGWRALRLVSRWQVRRLEPGAQAGDPVDAFNLALALERLGRDGDAERWYRWVAETGDVDGACNLGLLLARTGRENAALKHLGIAAKQGDSGAAYCAGEVCEDTDDIEGARYWYDMAARLGDQDAKTWLERNPPKTGLAAN